MALPFRTRHPFARGGRAGTVSLRPPSRTSGDDGLRPFRSPPTACPFGGRSPPVRRGVRSVPRSGEASPGMSVGVVLVILLLILVSSLYVAAEFAAVSVRRSRIQQRAEEGNWLASHLLPYIAE